MELVSSMGVLPSSSLPPSSSFWSAIADPSHRHHQATRTRMKLLCHHPESSSCSVARAGATAAVAVLVLLNSHLPCLETMLSSCAEAGSTSAVSHQHRSLAFPVSLLSSELTRLCQRWSLLPCSTLFPLV